MFYSSSSSVPLKVFPLLLAALLALPGASMAQQLAEVIARFHGQHGRQAYTPCPPSSPPAVSNAFTVQGPGVLVEQSWLDPFRNPAPQDSPPLGSGIFLPDLRRLTGFIRPNGTELALPPNPADGQRAYREVHYTVGPGGNYEGVTVRLVPFTFGLSCTQYQQDRRTVITFYPGAETVPVADDSAIAAGFAVLDGAGPDGAAAGDGGSTKPPLSGGPATTPPGTTTDESGATPPTVSGPVQTYQLGNAGAVVNGPTAPSEFRIERPSYLTRIQTYHWNDGRGTRAPGTISIFDQQGTIVGTWNAQGLPGSNDVPNANWVAYPDIFLEPGTYTVRVSDPSTWSTNAAAGGRGFFWIDWRDAS